MALLTNYLIRTPVREDLDEILKIEKASFDDPWTRKAFIEEFESLFAKNFLIFDSVTNQIIGYLLSRFMENEIDIMNIAIDPVYRKSGAALILLEHLFKLARKENLLRINLEVDKTNLPAINLYLKCGFSIVGTRKDYYGTGKDAHAMYLELKN